MLFIGKFKFLANDYPAKIKVNVPKVGVVAFDNVECAFLAIFAPDVARDIASMAPADARAYVTEHGREVPVEALDTYMNALVRQKFADPELAAQLMAVTADIHMDGPRPDAHFGRVKGSGEDVLGAQLTRLRDELKRAA